SDLAGLRAVLAGAPRGPRRTRLGARHRPGDCRSTWRSRLGREHVERRGTLWLHASRRPELIMTSSVAGEGRDGRRRSGCTGGSSRKRSDSSEWEKASRGREDVASEVEGTPSTASSPPEEPSAHPGLNPTLTPGQMARIATLGRHRAVRQGEILVETGEQRFAFYMVLRGHVQIILPARGVERRLRTIGPGEFTGDSHML